ncbi:MAG: tetratricopeptide repeat protein [Chloroflexi bacterium]|nr:tetratricopeptide repeat protein [Chloroflexota bacterium]
MAEISLSAYQDNLSQLSAQNKHDEVIAHSRHILKTHPKNLRAYQQLARALVAAGRWAEAADVLRRLLGAMPQDFETHTLLAQCYQRLDECERAIWHAERALDQEPNDAATIGLIRALYRRHRGEEIERLQLTAGALAQQQIRGNLLAEALETLDGALGRSPERIDLQLLRARALWLDGRRMDAAEAALDILEKLPYAIDANRIMTELWLAEQRPSDAQVYLQRIEALDPYLAHEIALGETPGESLVMTEEYDISGLAPPEQDIVDPKWLVAADEDTGSLDALFGIDGEAEPAETSVTADLDDLLSDAQIEQLFTELVIGEAVAETSDAEPDAELEQVLNEMEDRGYLDPAAQSASVAVHDEDDESDPFMAQMSASDAAEDEGAAVDETGTSPDDELASLLKALDDADDDEDWMAEIQRDSLALDEADESLEYLDDFEREWVKDSADEESAGAPWLAAAMRERMDQGEFDLFGEDEQLQALLGGSDTEPIQASDIEDWLNVETAPETSAADESALDLDDELLHAPPSTSWLETGADAEDPNQINSDLIDSWQSELGDDDDDDDPYVDWLSDDPNELDDDLGAFAAGADETAADEALALPRAGGDSAEQARAWGLDDADQLADFVEEGGLGEGAPDWMNAVVPGLDRENDADTNDPNEYARPMAAPGKEFGWVSDLVEEETGQMKAVEPTESGEMPYFRFSKQPAWLLSIQSEANEGAVVAGVALSLDEDLQALDLDDLTFDDYFNFNTPTDKMDVINLDEETQKLSFVGLDWDDYFDQESPTEKTIAISIDESAVGVEFEELGIDDDDFDFVSGAGDGGLDTASDLFDDASLGLESSAKDAPAWLGFEDPESDADSADPHRPNRDSTL